MKNKNIVVYTSICGGKDTLREDQYEGNNYVAFLDNPVYSRVWDVREIFKKCILPVREAKIFRILPWQFLDYEYSIWMDGQMAICCNASDLVDKFLDGYDIALFRHPRRDCIYEEYIADRAWHTYEPPFLSEKEEQKYKSENFPEHDGLYETTIIIRKHSEKIKQFCKTWWAEISAFSSFDQCNFMYAARKHNLKINDMIPGTVWNNPYFNHKRHLWEQWKKI